MNETMSMMLFMVVMLGVFYIFMIRPENKRKKELAKMRDELKVGDDITTIGGIFGTVCFVKEDTVVIETGADRVRVELAKWAIANKGIRASENAK